MPNAAACSRSVGRSERTRRQRRKKTCPNDMVLEEGVQCTKVPTPSTNKAAAGDAFAQHSTTPNTPKGPEAQRRRRRRRCPGTRKTVSARADTVIIINGHDASRGDSVGPASKKVTWEQRQVDASASPTAALNVTARVEKERVTVCWSSSKRRAKKARRCCWIGVEDEPY